MYTSSSAPRIISGWELWACWKAPPVPPILPCTAVGRSISATARAMAALAWSMLTPSARAKLMLSAAKAPSCCTRSSSRLRSQRAKVDSGTCAPSLPTTRTWSSASGCWAYCGSISITTLYWLRLS
ncbi:hypothetical protein D9M71_697660 [compost metagenome]